MARRHKKHTVSKLWSHFGPFGDQGVHFHPCIAGDGSCTFVLIGDGRDCDGVLETHRRVTL